MTKTRAQEDMERAAEAVIAVSEQPTEVHTIYGSLCHSFPIMVRTCGLCQAVAFSAAKAQAADSHRQTAHRLLLNHVGAVIGAGANADANTVLRYIQSVDASQYIFYTRRLMAAWIYYKRFAVSVLSVENAAKEEE